MVHSNGGDIQQIAQSVKWAIFDLDSTIIQQETIDELARYAGVYERVKEITNQSMAGNLPFTQSLKKRCLLFKGLDGSVWKDILGNIEYTEKVFELFSVLRARGIKTAIISGGFMEIVERVGKQLQADCVLANQLEYDADGRMTGILLGDIVDEHMKRKVLLELSGGDAMAVGDGANDALMLKAAKLGIAFMGKPITREAAHFCVDSASMQPIIDLFAPR